MSANQLLQLQRKFTILVNYQRAAITAVSQATEQEARESTTKVPLPKNLQQRGNIRFSQRTLQLTRNTQSYFSLSLI